MDKLTLRRYGKDILNSISSHKKTDLESSLYSHLFVSDLWKQSQSIGVTVSQAHEWSTYPIIEKGWEEHKNVSVPKCDPKDKQMQFYHLEGYHQLETVYFGLKEPDPRISKEIKKNEIDLLLVPGLLFSDQGYRIGYGGGFYDRFLHDYDGISVMIASEQQRHNPLPVDQYDQRVDYILSERGMIKTG